jgi:hypothetical protein
MGSPCARSARTRLHSTSLSRLCHEYRSSLPPFTCPVQLQAWRPHRLLPSGCLRGAALPRLPRSASTRRQVLLAPLCGHAAGWDRGGVTSCAMTAAAAGAMVLPRCDPQPRCREPPGPDAFAPCAWPTAPDVPLRRCVDAARGQTHRVPHRPCGPTQLQLLLHPSAAARLPTRRLWLGVSC